jgi:hypothetical protein
MFRLGWAFRAWIPFEALFAYDIGSLTVGAHLPFIPPVHYLSPPYQPPTDWMVIIPPYLLIWPMENTFSGLLTDYILLILGVVLGLVGMDRGWRYKAWIPLGVFLLIVTVYTTVEVAMGHADGLAMAYIQVWSILMIVELLGVALAIVGIGRGWGYKAGIPLAVLSVPIDLIFMYVITYVPG